MDKFYVVMVKDSIFVYSTVGEDGYMIKAQTTACCCDACGLHTKVIPDYTNAHFCVQVGAYCNYNRAMELQLELIEKGFSSDIIRSNELYAVNAGNFRELDRAAALECYLRHSGYNTMLVTKQS